MRREPLDWGLAGVGGQEFEVAVDHLGSVQRLADLEDRSVGEFGALAEGLPAVAFQAVVAVEHQHAFGGQGVVDALGDALADPVEVGRFGVIEKRQH